MPTSLPRIQVTRTPRVDQALELAAAEWPGVPRAELVTRLLEEGAASLSATGTARRAQRRAALEQTRGSLAAVFPPGYLEELREDWPA
ncbi:hypothetical protein [Protaetiibacter intestinalis]|uniref:hypothetical protein n=1 Tax=Protaetiibacter intestinalis TaxID=2419774 RepID=UPI0013009738|nr:hypothetical protein [Protaetiibacter intestinalis]